MSYCSFGGEKYRNHFHPGIYVCSNCKHELFTSVSKFEHSSPWPSFSSTIWPNSVRKEKEPLSRTALKVYCGKCGSSLGHDFQGEGPNQGSRF
ncbi:putative selenoprotein X-like protein [Leptotrombidium deliense]|uniref:peptide-methionine (R)-S-oxide reductase n=1 Tax=Leptotrombidium deliense TaxID=299467 RepID=A0A443S7I7_9ACAR|nr:putative selenoprotein X-like protein [Leptotrombidium deliense]